MRQPRSLILAVRTAAPRTHHSQTEIVLGQKGPLDGMYLAGAWTQPGGGFQPSMSSGQTAAALVLRDIRKSAGGAR